MDHIQNIGIAGRAAGITTRCKLFQTGAFRREYGNCKLCPKCPKKQLFEKKIDEDFK